MAARTRSGFWMKRARSPGVVRTGPRRSERRKPARHKNIDTAQKACALSCGSRPSSEPFGMEKLSHPVEDFDEPRAEAAGGILVEFVDLALLHGLDPVHPRHAREPGASGGKVRCRAGQDEDDAGVVFDDPLPFVEGPFLGQG